MGQEEPISDARWELEDLDSDAEVNAAKARKLEEAKQDKGEVSRTFQLQSLKIEESLAVTSPKLQLAGKMITAKRSKKHLQGLYNAVPEGISLVKTTDATLTLKVPGQKETVRNKADVAKFGTAEQRKIPLINSVACKTIRNHHTKFKQQMEGREQAQRSKIMGEHAIEQEEHTERGTKSQGNLTASPT